MFTLKNAVKNIYRYKNKYILFGVLYFIVILAASVCVNIFLQMEQITGNVLKEYASVSKLSFSNPINSKRIIKDEYLKLINTKNISDIKFLSYSFAMSYLKEGIAPLNLEIHNNGNFTSLCVASRFIPTFVVGYNTSLLHIAPTDFNLDSGKMFEKDDEAVIAKNINFVPPAGEDVSWEGYEEWNALDLGDKIVIKNDDGIYKEFNVVGIKIFNEGVQDNRRIIYTTLESAEYFDAFAAPESGQGFRIGHAPENITNIADIEIITLGYDVLVFTESPEKFLELQNELWSVEINGFNVIVEPLFPHFRLIINLTRNLQYNAIFFTRLITFIIIIVTIISTAILLIIRKYEIAVLRSAGMKKSRIIFSYLIENLAFIWGISVISVIAAQFMAQIFTKDLFTNMQNLTSAEVFKNITAVNIEMILQNAGITFAGTTAVVMLSLILAVINILRLEPLKIFNKQY